MSLRTFSVRTHSNKTFLKYRKRCCQFFLICHKSLCVVVFNSCNIIVIIIYSYFVRTFWSVSIYTKDSEKHKSGWGFSDRTVAKYKQVGGFYLVQYHHDIHLQSCLLWLFCQNPFRQNINKKEKDACTVLPRVPNVLLLGGFYLVQYNHDGHLQNCLLWVFLSESSQTKHR